MPCDYSEYPENWPEIRARILARAHNRCEDCKLLNHDIIRKVDRKNPSPNEWDMYNDLLHRQYSKAQAMKIMGFTKIVLTIAHLDNDHRNKEVTDDRLRALCQRCHLKMDIPHHIENRKYGRNHREKQIKLF